MVPASFTGYATVMNVFGGHLREGSRSAPSTDPDPAPLGLIANVAHGFGGQRLPTLPDRLIKIGGKMVGRARYVVFQLAEVAIPRELPWMILARIRQFEPIEPRAAPI